MNGAEFTALMPLLAVAATSIVVMAATSVGRNRRLAAVLTVAGLAGSFGLLFVAHKLAPVQVTPLLIIDGFSLFFFALIIAAAAVVAVLAAGYLPPRGCPSEEFYLLLLFATLGSCVLAGSTHFASIFLGLEVLSVSLYAMVGYLRVDGNGLEAAVKYLILAAASSAFLLFGMALIYAQTGSLELTVPTTTWSLATVAGAGLIMVGAGFKLALVPFHMWTADVYQGAPAPVTAFVASASKAAMAALLLRWLTANGAPPQQLVWLMAVLAAASILVGNLLALKQDNVKRLLAYSSIAHLGYLMIAIVAGGARGSEAAAFYLAAYIPTTLIAFGVVTALSPAERELDRLADYHGLGSTRPALAGLLTVAMLSLAGIPLTAGFVGKFLVLGAGVGAGQWILALILVLGSAISIYYYLRVVVAIYMTPAEDEATELPAVPFAAGAVLAALLVVILWLGVWPSTVLNILQ